VSDEIDINPRSPAEAGRRLIVLASLIRRGFLEEELALETLHEEVADEQFDLLAWLSDHDLDKVLTPGERELLNTPIGQIAELDLYDQLSQIDAAITLAWYLGLIDDMPEFLATESEGNLFELVPAPWDPVGPWLHELKARPLEELAIQRELAEIWSWRADVAERRRTSTGEQFQEIDVAIRESAIEAVNAGLVPRQIHGDLPIGDNAFGDLSPDEQDSVWVAAFDRLHALNWLCGYGENWSDVPLEV
jgi:hypothetical protein